MSDDLRPTADEVYWRRLREMTPGDRLRAALDISESIREVARAGIRAQYPHFSAEQVQAELRRRIEMYHDTVRAARACSRHPR